MPTAIGINKFVTHRNRTSQAIKTCDIVTMSKTAIPVTNNPIYSGKNQIQDIIKEVVHRMCFICLIFCLCRFVLQINNTLVKYYDDMESEYEYAPNSLAVIRT